MTDPTDPTDHAGPSRELGLTPDLPPSGASVLPQPPREGFELGAIDVSSERPSHGLAPDRSTRWLVMGLVGGSLVLAGLITLIRGDDDDPSGGDAIELRASLGDPLRSSMLALEAVRLEAIHVTAVRALGDMPGAPQPTSRKPSRANDGATPAATTPAASTPASGSRDGHGASTPANDQRVIGELPPPPPEEAEPPRGDQPKGDPSPPAEPAPAESPPTVDGPDAEPRAEPQKGESGSAPSGV
jgi:hypothetical protein